MDKNKTENEKLNRETTVTEKKLEQIGKINLDLTYYPGEDFYCDGAIEDELLRIARDYSVVEYPKIIEESRNWEILYHLSKQRENIVEWLPITKDMKVLEVGSGCGAITGALAEKAGSVTCIDLSKKRSMINAYRHMENDNVTIQVGNFKDVEPSLDKDYDYICLIGVFEYGQAYIGGEKPFETFLNILKKHLKKDGHIAIAIENKFGLKYWAGCKEDHLGTYFSGLEGYPDGGVVRTFTRPGLEEIFANCGVSEYSFYYPYPDYKFMTTVYSDDYLPKQGELSNNKRNFDRDRMQLFDEKKVYDSILNDGLFPLYSNSYMVIIGKELDVKYAKYSNDRQVEYQICTEILKQKESLFPFIVRKRPLTDSAESHIRNIEIAYKKLKERYSGSELKINRCKLVEDAVKNEDAMPESALQEKDTEKVYVELEYIEGCTLAELMDACLVRDDTDGFMKLFDKYCELLDYHSNMPVTDYDLIFANILLSTKDATKPFDALNNANWTLIDYEWTFGKQVDMKELAFRAVCCYILEDKKREKLSLDLITEKLEISDKDAEEYRLEEKKFQRFVTGNRRSMVEIRDLIGQKIHEPETWIEKMAALEQKSRIQVYADTGLGFNEEESYFVEDYSDNKELVQLQLSVEPGVRNLRIDPAFAECIFTLHKAEFNQVPVEIMTNGTKLDDSNSYVFNSEDPNIVISLEDLPFEEVSFLDIDYEIAFVTKSMAESMEAAAKKRFRLKA